MMQTKGLALTVMIALMVPAFDGTSSAMGESTALCKTDESICISGAITHIHAATQAGTKATLLTSAFNIECNGLFLGDARSSLASPLIVDGAVTYSNCVLNGTGCTVTEENGPAEVKVLRTGHESAELTFKLLLHAICGGAINCTYTGETLVGHLIGPLLSTSLTGEIKVEKQTVTRESGAFCPTKGQIDVLGAPLEALYIAS